MKKEDNNFNSELTYQNTCIILFENDKLGGKDSDNWTCYFKYCSYARHHFCSFLYAKETCIFF